MNMKFVILVIMMVTAITEIRGHGMMLEPPGRSSRWRYDSSAPTNYDDNGLYCGGYWTQWGTHNGKCGLCGDNYGLARPRPNELGGTYGQGVITQIFTNNTPTIGFRITANHQGYVYFNLCNLDEFNNVESEECYSKYRLLFKDGSDKFYVGTGTGDYTSTIVFPDDLSCIHCVLRWTYHAGNNWGSCGNGTSALGCGPQENFVSCSDISIKSSGSHEKEPEPEPPVPEPEDPIDVEDCPCMPKHLRK